MKGHWVQQSENTQNHLAELRERLFDLETTMVNSYTQQRDRNREMFNLCAEIEMITNPISYEKNKAHYEGHQNRF